MSQSDKKKKNQEPDNIWDTVRNKKGRETETLCVQSYTLPLFLLLFIKPMRMLTLAREPLWLRGWGWGLPWVAAAILEFRMDRGREEGEERRRQGEKEEGWGEKRAQHRIATKERKRKRKIQKKQEGTRQRERGSDKKSESGRRTYVDLTENDVYYAANYDEEIKHIPGITKVPLHRMRWARGGGGG